METLANISYGNIARNATQAKYPQLWRGLVGLWVPSVGKQGDQLIDFSCRGNPMLYTSASGGPLPTWGSNPGRPGVSVTTSYTDASYLAAVNSGSLLANGSQVTAMGWAVKTSAQICPLIQKFVLSNDFLSAEVYTDGNFYIELNQTVVVGPYIYGSVAWAGLITQGVFFHWTGIWDLTQATNATAFKFYVNGRQQTLTFTGTYGPMTLPSSAARWEIGKLTANPGDSIFDDVRLYSRVLSDAEIRFSMLHSPLEMQVPVPVFKIAAAAAGQPDPYYRLLMS